MGLFNINVGNNWNLENIYFFLKSVYVFNIINCNLEICLNVYILKLFSLFLV